MGNTTEGTLAQCDFINKSIDVENIKPEASKSSDADNKVDDLPIMSLNNKNTHEHVGSGRRYNGGEGRHSRNGGRRPNRHKDNGNSFTERNDYRSMDDETPINNELENIPSDAKIVDMTDLKSRPIAQLLDIASQYDIAHIDRLSKSEIIATILKKTALNGEYIKGDGILEILQDGFGFLRSEYNNYKGSYDDIYINQTQIKRFHLKTGDAVAGYIKAPKSSERYFSLIKLVSINGNPIENKSNKFNFDDLVPLHPTEKLNFDTPIGAKKDISTRIIDLISPIGKGQRALIVAPPRSGKTVLMQNIAHAINKKHPDVHLIVLLIDERPEEVTDMIRSVSGEVVSSTFDEPASRHVALAEIVIARAKRMVENGIDVVILLDSITRLARAYNAMMPSSGKVLSGGVDAGALQRPKRFFGAARNIENGGSLTIIATALIDTGSRMDEVIFEEFKGTGNSEIVLDRKLGEKRLFPAIDINKSGTRKEEEMIDGDTLAKMWMLRRFITRMGEQSGSDGLEFLITKIKETNDNIEFFAKMNS